MKKADRKLLDESLSKALDPPRKKPRANLDALLDEYDEPTPPSTPPSTRPSTPPTRPSTPPSTPPSGDVAPKRDFMKVANSITREAVPSGLFTGKSKQLYDYLYSLTRGAIVPTRYIRVSREQLMKGASIGSKVTLEQNLRRLIATGLVSMRIIGGIQGGNEYTVFLPEELTPPSTPPSPPTPPSGGQKLAPLAPLETSPPRGGLTLEDSMVSGEPKTSFKTKEENFDDEAFAGLNEVLKEMAREATGKSPTKAEQERWREIGEVLKAELRLAAGRTTVSSVPSFLAEHLRRRLWKLDRKQAQAEGRELPDQPSTANLIPAGQNCVDCNNTGWWYPHGADKGVARCKHEHLAPAAAADL